MIVRTVFACLGLLAATATNALPIVDSGSSTYLENWQPGVSLVQDQFIAGRFTTTEDYSITSLGAFVRDYSCCGTHTFELTLSLRSGPTELDHSQLTTLVSSATSITLEEHSAGWASASIDNYLLTAGTWWIVASIEPGQYGFMGMPGGVSNPMDAYGFWSGETGTWRPMESHLAGTLIPATFGFRVDGDVVTVPEPSTNLLLLSLTVGLAASRRKRVKAAREAGADVTTR